MVICTHLKEIVDKSLKKAKKKYQTFKSNMVPQKQEPKKKWITCYSHLEFSSRFLILVRGFSVAFIICIKCQKLKLFNEYKQVKNL